MVHKKITHISSAQLNVNYLDQEIDSGDPIKAFGLSGEALLTKKFTESRRRDTVAASVAHTAHFPRSKLVDDACLFSRHFGEWKLYCQATHRPEPVRRHCTTTLYSSASNTTTTTTTSTSHTWRPTQQS